MWALGIKLSYNGYLNVHYDHANSLSFYNIEVWLFCYLFFDSWKNQKHLIAQYMSYSKPLMCSEGILKYLSMEQITHRPFEKIIYRTDET